MAPGGGSTNGLGVPPAWALQAGNVLQEEGALEKEIERQPSALMAEDSEATLKPRTHSAIYEGIVRHRRYTPVSNRFTYRLFMMYLDLAELDTLFANRWCWGTERRTLATFRRSDHLKQTALPLDLGIRDLVEERTGHRPPGPIRLLTHLRYFGHCFNPVSFYYCFDGTGMHVEAIAAEVNNTPWGEQHFYVARRVGEFDRRLRLVGEPKAMHVSPFMEMDHTYDWSFNEPGKVLSLHMENRQRGELVFDASMNLRRQEISGRSLASVLARYPAMTGRVVGLIHWQALKLWWKGSPFHTHPGNQPGSPR